jgi:nucleoside-diphosphate-sugar epimerase
MRSWEGARVLVLGGAGFVGSHLARRLAAEGGEVHLLVRPTTSLWRLDDIRREVTLWRGDMVSLDDVRACVSAARPEVVFNLAGMRRLDRDIGMIDRSVDVNLCGTLNVVKALQDREFPFRCLVQTGSFEEYGDGPVPFDEGQREQPVSPYSASKVAATHFCQMVSRCLGFPVVVLRACHVYGPFQDTDMLVPLMITHCLEGKTLEMTLGDQTRDLAYVSDMVEAHLLAAACPAAIGEVINIGSGTEYRIRDIAERIASATGGKDCLNMGAFPRRPAEIQRVFGRIEKARGLLGWKPAVDLDAGLEMTVAWYRQWATGPTEVAR